MLAACQSPAHDARVLRFLRDPVLHSQFRWRTLSVGIACLLARNALAVAAPWCTGRAVDVIVNHGERDTLHTLLLMMLCAAGVTATCQWWMRWLIIGWSRHVEREQRASLFRHMLRVPLTPFRSLRRGELLARLTSAPEAVRMAYGPGLMHATGTAAMALSALTLMLLTAPWLTLVAAVPMLALFFALRPMLARIHVLSTRAQELQGALAAEAQESFSGVRVVKTLGREDQRRSEFGAASLRLQDTSLALVRQKALFSCCIELFTGVSILLIFLVGGHAVLNGSLTLGEFTAFSGYLNLLVWPMIALGWTLGLFQTADANLDLINSLRALPEESRQGEAGTPDLSIEARHLSFSYDTQPVLNDVSFMIRHGQSFGIVGRMGSGKSTLIHLLLRLQDPPRGTLFVGGRDVLDWSPQALRAAFGVVLQESFLFSDTVRTNLSFARRPAAQDIEDALRTAACDDEVHRLPKGLDTEVGERGVTLSGGQRQRLCLARTLLRNPPALLLDDTLSAVDAETEARISAGLLRTRRTTLIATHRLHVMQHMDCVLVLDQGRLVQQGTHDQLLRERGRYAQLWTTAEDLDSLEREA